MVESAVGKNRFTVGQVGGMVDLLDMSPDKVKVVARVKTRIIDRDNAFSLDESFTFEAARTRTLADGGRRSGSGGLRGSRVARAARRPGG